jgi:subtilisin
MIKKTIFSTLFAVALLAGAAFTAVTAIAANAAHAENEHASDNAKIVPGQYIVVFKDDVADSSTASDEIVQKHGLGLSHKYESVIKGFAATIPAARLDDVKKDSRVAFISEDRIVSADGKPSNPGAGKGGNGNPQPSTQFIPTGIQRIASQTNSNKGANIGIAVIDTGIDLTHPDLAANVSNLSKTCVTGTRNADDDNGHGTHVAGTIAALDNSFGVIGVAPQASLFAVKVLDRNGNGTWSSVICGIDWVSAHAATNNIKVANMSLTGGGTSDNNCGITNNDALHKAICSSVAKGVTYVVAAGNENSSVAQSVPSAYDDAVITVSALADSDGLTGGLGSLTSYGADDTFASFSNFGAGVDIAAPGVGILSTWKDGGYNTISGTSMATPHVTGAAALFIKSHPGSTWTQVRDGLQAVAEALGAGHTDPSGLHPEKVLQAAAL